MAFQWHHTGGTGAVEAGDEEGSEGERGSHVTVTLVTAGEPTIQKAKPMI